MGRSQEVALVHQEAVLLATARLLEQESEQAQVQGVASRALGRLEAVAMERHLEATVAVQVGPQEVANLALARGHLCLWISSHVADPTDSPHPKGWETTLEPYLSL